MHSSSPVDSILLFFSFRSLLWLKGNPRRDFSAPKAHSAPLASRNETFRSYRWTARSLYFRCVGQRARSTRATSWYAVEGKEPKSTTPSFSLWKRKRKRDWTLGWDKAATCSSDAHHPYLAWCLAKAYLKSNKMYQRLSCQRTDRREKKEEGIRGIWIESLSVKRGVNS